MSESSIGAESRVSIITVFLNEGRFLQEAIESVLGQSRSDWELLLVDDGSTDGSTALARGYSERYPDRIRYLEHEGHQNRGMSASRNLGIRSSRAPYIAFLDADDVWFPHKLEQQLAVMKEFPDVAAVCGRSQWWYSWSGSPADAGRDFLQRFGVPLDGSVEPPDLLLNFLRDEWASPCDLMVRRRVVEAVGGYEESFRGMYEDQAFHAKLCLKHAVYVSSRCWYRYRQHPEAATSRSHRAGGYHAARLRFLNWLGEYLAAQGGDRSKLGRLIEQKVWSLRHPVLAKITRRVRMLSEGTAERIRRVRPPFFLGRLTPVSREFGLDRGLPVDRYYIEKFLAAHATDIKGHVLEIKDSSYTERFGAGRVTHSDVLEAPLGPHNPRATIIADLTCAEQLRSETFDCIILTQTLQFIYDLRAAVATLYRILKPGGVVLATVPGASQICREESEIWGDYWRFTSQSAQRLFEALFPLGSVRVEAYGNVRTVAGFLYGQAAHELPRQVLDYRDPDYELIVSIQAAKPSRNGSPR